MIKNNLFDLKNKLAFVIGGNGLLVKEIAKILNDYNAKVVVLDLNFNKKFFDKKINFEKIDVSNLNSIDIKLNTLTKKYGCPNILVNASYPRSREWKNSNFDKLTIKLLRKNVDMHMNSYAWLAIYFGNLMRKNKIRGSIILLNSIYGIHGQDLNIYKGTEIKLNPVYSLIKGGLNIFVKNAASHYGKNKIRVNSLICGGIEGHIAGSKNKQSKTFKSNYSKRTLLKRMGKPEDIISSIILLSSDSSSYITGTNIVIDGGWTSI